MTRLHRWAWVTGICGVLVAAAPWLAEGSAYALADAQRVRFHVGGAALLVFALLLRFSPDPADIARPELVRRYYRESLAIIGAYIATAVILRALVSDPAAPGARLGFAALHLLYLAALTRSFVRYVRDSDELQRRIELESIAIATLVVAAGYTVAGDLQRAGVIAVDAAAAMHFVFVGVALAYGVVRAVLSRRYQ